MNVDRILLLKLLGDTSSIDKSLRGTSSRMKSLARGSVMWGKAITAGLVIEGIDKVTEALGDAWTGFREGEQAAAQLGTTWKNLGLDGSRLQGTIDAISESTLKLGTDDTEAIMAFNQALQNTGGKPTEAMRRLRIAQDLVANGSAPSLSSALKLIDRAASGSASTVRKFGLTSDTAAGRVKELGEKVKGAAKRKADLDPLAVLFNRMNEDLEGIVGSLASGDLDSALTSLRDIGTSLSDTWAKVEPAVTNVLDKLTGGKFSEFVSWLDKTAKPLVEKFVAVIDDMAYAWQNIQPILDQTLTFIQPLLDLLSTTAEGGLGFILDAISGTLRTLGTLLTGDFSAAFDTAGEAVGRMWDDLTKIVGGIGTFLDKAAGGVLKSAQDIGNNIFKGIAGAVSNLVQFVARTWNSLGAFPAGGFTFAEAFDIEILGQHVGWPKLAVSWGAGDIIPNIAVPGSGGPGGSKAKNGYKKGLWDVPMDNMAAILHKGETVVPADFAQQLRANGGFGGGDNIVVNITAGVGDPVAIGEQVVKVLRAYSGRRGNADLRVLVGR